MAASHFFIGLSAGIALLAVPVLTLTPGSSVPQHVIDWIEGPPPAAATQARSTDAPVDRPLHGYQPGDPTPAPQVVPTIGSLAAPTPAPSSQQQPPAQGQAQQPLVSQPALDSLRWAGTGVIRSGGIPVYVRRVAGVDSRDDAQIADGSPVLVSTGPPLQVGAQQWRAVRGLSGVVGWVPSAQLVVDGESPPAAPQQPPAVQPTLQAAGPTAQPANAGVRATIGRTDGIGVVLRNSPNDADRTHSGLMDGTPVTLLEFSGSDWAQVRADNGLTGWVPIRYVMPAQPAAH